jgi:hypothetical protein
MDSFLDDGDDFSLTLGMFYGDWDLQLSQPDMNFVPEKQASTEH